MAYRSGSKPLPIELRSKILAKAKKSGIPSTEHLTEPTLCLDPEDKTTWEHFFNPTRLRHPRKTIFSPNQLTYVIGQEIEGSPVFELYSIVITKLDPIRDFSAVHMMGSNTDYVSVVVYKLPEGSQVRLDYPLRIKNIFRLPSALHTVTLSLSNPRSWSFSHNHLFPGDIQYGIHRKNFKDEVTDSEATICYELIERAAVAELSFKFVDGKERSIQILSGTVCVTNDGNLNTKRLIGDFSSPVVVKSNEVLPVDRSIFGVPINSNLKVSAQLTYLVEEEGPYEVGGSITFQVPNTTLSDQKCFSGVDAGTTKLSVEVSWWDYMG